MPTFRFPEADCYLRLSGDLPAQYGCKGENFSAIPGIDWTEEVITMKTQLTFTFDNPNRPQTVEVALAAMVLEKLLAEVRQDKTL